jgi:methyl-accepting chemotaxis protein
MNDLLTNETLQAMAWFIALLEFILALYIILLNPRHTANRHVGFLLLLFAVNSSATGTLVGATTAAQALLPTQLLSATTASLQVGLLLTALVLLFPRWLQGRWRVLKWVLYAFLIFPMVLVLMDSLGDTTLWYSGFIAFRYTGGYLPVSEVTKGELAQHLRPFYMNVLPLLTFIPLFWAALRRPRGTDSGKLHAPLTRRLAWALICVQMLAVVLQLGLRRFLAIGAAATLSSAMFALGYAYVSFWQFVSERRVQRGRLRSRLIGLTLVVALPILIALSAFVLVQSLEVIERQSFEKLEATNRLLVTNMELWLDFNVKALQQLATHPDILSLDPVQQQPIMAAMQRVYPSIYLVSTTDLKGVNVARSDGGALTDYSDRDWFKQSRLGVPVVYEVVTGRTSGEPALVVAMPIRDRLAYPVGVAMFATTLNQLNQDIAATRFGETGVAYVVDMENRIVLHPNTAVRGVVLDPQNDPLIARMRDRREKEFSFVDAGGERWQAYVQVLNNGWGIVVQQKWSELQRPLVRISHAGVVGALLGVLLLSALTFFTMRQAFVPIDTLTATAAAIVAGI